MKDKNNVKEIKKIMNLTRRCETILFKDDSRWSNNRDRIDSDTTCWKNSKEKHRRDLKQ